MTLPPSDEAAERFRALYVALESTYISYPRVEKVLRAIRQLHALSGVGSEGRCLLLTGASRSGKTQVLRRYLETHQERRSTSADMPTVLYVEVPAACTMKSLSMEILRSLNDPWSERGTTATLNRRAARMIDASGVELVIFDEFNQLINRQFRTIAYEVADYVRYLLNESTRSFVLAGLPEIREVLQANVQLKLRCIDMESLPPFRWSDSEEQKIFRNVLATFEQVLFPGAPACLPKGETAYLIHTFSQGYIGAVTRLLTSACRLVADRGAASFDHQTIAEASEMLKFNGQE